MSRAAAVVSTSANSAGYRVRQSVAIVRYVLAAGSGPPAFAGSGTTLAAAAGDGPQASRSLAPVPRSSKLTRSNPAATAGGTSEARTGRICTPLSPGPPGLKSRTPGRPTGAVAGFSITASDSDGPAGWS